MINLYEALKNFPPFSRQLVCRDLLLTQYECPQTEKRECFYLESNLIVYVISGRRIFHKNSKSWDLTEGVCAFIKKGTQISERKEDDGWCVMAFFMPDNFLKHIIKEHRTNLSLSNLGEASTEEIILLDVNDISKSFFISMYPYFEQTPPPPENLVELKFKELLLSLLSNKKNAPLLSYLNILQNDKHPSVEEVMQNNYTFNLTLAEYAHLACKSVPTFKREFKKIFRETPARWVMKKRLNLAIELLENTNQSISEISFECGFENQAHFSRIFKAKNGVPPLQYRINLQSATPI